LTPVEAYTFGTPALVLRAGGYLDTTIEGVTGEFVDRADVGALVDGIRRIESRSYEPTVIRRHASSFSLESFVAQLRAEVARVLSSSTVDLNSRLTVSPESEAPSPLGIAG